MQQKALTKFFGAVRFVYNYFLKQRIERHKDGLKNSNAADISLTAMKKLTEYNWLNLIYASSLQQALIDLDKAYSNYFNKRAKFPKFKKKRGKQSCRFICRFKFNGTSLYVPKIGWVKIDVHRTVIGNVKNFTVTKTKTDKYFVSILVEQEIAEPIYQGDKIGLDLGLKDFAVTSDNQHFPAPKFFRKSEKKLKRLQRKLSRTKKGSNGREKARLAVARQHEKIANQREDFLHKLSRKLIEENQLIVLEDLNVEGMLKNHKLAKSISDVGWSEFIRQLKYKGAWYGCHVEQIDRFFPSSKQCFHCGYINQALTLADRKWLCPECHTSLDRDVNAAQNILNWYTVGTTEINASGQKVRPDLSGSLDDRGNS